MLNFEFVSLIQHIYVHKLIVFTTLNRLGQSGSVIHSRCAKTSLFSIIKNYLAKKVISFKDVQLS